MQPLPARYRGGLDSTTKGNAMADAVKISNMPDGGSPARVAYDLWYMLRANLPSTGDNKAKMQRQLDLYAQCLNAASGSKYDISNIT